MTKKDNEIDYAQFEQIIQDALANSQEFFDEINKTSHNNFKIQLFEEYLLEMGYKAPPKKIRKDFPDLFGVKIDDKTDMISETPGLEKYPGELFYFDMLALSKELEIKKAMKKLANKKKNEKDVKNKQKEQHTKEKKVCNTE